MNAARQTFENGNMFWYDFDGGMIFAVADGGWWDVYPDTGQLKPPAVPPDGFYVPERGFGKVWDEYNLYQRLGWAIAPEQPGTGTCQEIEGDWEIRFGTDFYAKLQPFTPDPVPQPEPDEPPFEPPEPEPDPDPWPPPIPDPAFPWPGPGLDVVILPVLQIPLNLCALAYVDQQGRAQFAFYDYALALPMEDARFVGRELAKRRRYS